MPIFQTGNLSLGVNLQMALIREARATLGAGFDVEIIERHHRRKIDAPSGTALMLAGCIEEESTAETELVFGRHETNRRRTDGEIGIHSVRGGTIVGEHEVLFLGRDEVLEINHRAYSKQVFATGALRAAAYLLQKQHGLYSMQDIVTEGNVASHVTALEDQAILNLSGLPADGRLVRRILALVAERGVVVDMISLSLPGGAAACLGFTMPQAQLSDALNALLPLSGSVPFELFTEGGMTKLVIEGPGMALRTGVAAEVLGVLEDARHRRAAHHHERDEDRAVRGRGAGRARGGRAPAAHPQTVLTAPAAAPTRPAGAAFLSARARRASRTFARRRETCYTVY